MADGLLKGWAFGRGVMDDAFAAKRTGKLAALASQAYGAEPTQRSGLLQQAIGVDPNAGFALGKQLGQDDDARNERLGMMARVLTSVPEDARPGLYRQMVPELSRFGLSSLPPEYTPEVGQIAQQLADAFGGAGPGNNVQSRFVDQQGNVLALMRDGTVRPLGVQAENRLQIRDQPGVPLGAFDPRAGTIRGVQEAGAPQPQQMAPGEVPFSIDPNLPPAVQAAIRANPQQFASMGDGQSVTVPGVMPSQSGVAASRPAVSPAEQARLEIAAAANQRAEEANARAARAAEQAQRGNAPAGFRFKADGSLEPIPGGPKPAGAMATEGERKAATLLKRLEGSLSQLESAVQDDPAAVSPSLAAEIGRSLPFVGEVAANTLNSPERQRVEAAQLDMLDAALTLGTGAAYTREQLQGYRRSFFPQIGDSDATVRDKSQRLQNVIEAARIAAGRAASAVGTPDSGGGWSIKRIGD